MSEDNNKSDHAPKEEVKTQEPVKERADDESTLPLFLRKGSEGDRGDAQDEKDSSGE